MGRESMKINELRNNEYFNEQLFFKLREFKKYIESYSDGLPFTSFQEDGFIDAQENYKKEIWKSAKSKKDGMEKIKDFGSGKLLTKLIECIEIPNNNLLDWHGKKGPTSKDHAKLFDLYENKKVLKEFEKETWNFYFSNNQFDGRYFDYFTRVVGRRYNLIAYLCFIKSRSKYLPIATETFDAFFEECGLNFRTSKQCSWENYCDYILILDYIKQFLKDNLDPDAILLDAHSFIWILERQYKRDIENGAYTIPKGFALKEKDREVVAKARTGQGLYRSLLLKKWKNMSSISDYNNVAFMVASHIKPWKNCNNQECVDPENGLLLTPNYDFLFDQGYITFDDAGNVILSSKITEEDISEFSFDKNTKIKAVSEKMKEYLMYHRKFVFKGEK